MIDAKPRTIDSRTQVEGANAAVPLLRKRLLLRYGVCAAAYNNHVVVHSVSRSRIVSAWDGELAHEGIVGDARHPVRVIGLNLQGAESLQQAKSKAGKEDNVDVFHI